MTDDDDMITIGTFGDPTEAEVVKNLLVAEGIPAFVTGGESGGLFAGMGGQFGLVRLLVAESDRERALAILDEKPEEEPEGEAESEPSTAIKTPDWAREPAGKEETRGQAEIQAAPGIRETSSADEGVRELSAAKEGPDDEDEDEVQVAWGAEDYAARAWKASVIGLLVFPPLLHVYSVYCLMRAFSTGEPLSPKGMRNVYAALVFDVVALTLIPLFCCGGWIPVWPRLVFPGPTKERHEPSLPGQPHAQAQPDSARGLFTASGPARGAGSTLAPRGGRAALPPARDVAAEGDGAVDHQAQDDADDTEHHDVLQRRGRRILGAKDLDGHVMSEQSHGAFSFQNSMPCWALMPAL